MESTGINKGLPPKELNMATSQPERVKLPDIIPGNRPLMYADFIRITGEQDGGASIEFSKYYPEQHLCREEQTIVIPSALAKEMIVMLANMYQYFPSKEEAKARLESGQNILHEKGDLK